jgi:hypothetical protein
MIKSNISVKLLGAARIKGMGEEITRIPLGVLGGVCTGLFAAKAQDGVTDIWGLKGDFFAQVVKNDAEGKPYIEEYASGKCYMPEQIQNVIEGLFLGTPKLDDKGEPIKDANGKVVYEDGKQPIKSLEFRYKAYAIRATNKAGYSYEFEPLMEAAAADPMAAAKAASLAALGFDNSGKALPAPKAGK